MKTNLFMIDIRYAKEVLAKVSFERSIFRRELVKFLNIISTEQHSEFKTWCISKFGEKHGDIIDAAFSTSQSRLEERSY